MGLGSGTSSGGPRRVTDSGFHFAVTWFCVDCPRMFYTVAKPEDEPADQGNRAVAAQEAYHEESGDIPPPFQGLLKMGGIMDNMNPEPVPLRNPKKMEPVVSVEVKKAIFPPDDDKTHDGEKVIRSDEVTLRAPCHASVHVSVSCYWERRGA